MIRKIIAILLFLYAAVQIVVSVSTAIDSGASYRIGQGLAQIMWGLLAVLAGTYLWRRSNKKKGN